MQKNIFLLFLQSNVQHLNNYIDVSIHLRLCHVNFLSGVCAAMFLKWAILPLSKKDAFGG